MCVYLENLSTDLVPSNDRNIDRGIGNKEKRCVCFITHGSFSVLHLHVVGFSYGPMVLLRVCCHSSVQTKVKLCRTISFGGKTF